jgi:hypothetical protein
MTQQVERGASEKRFVTATKTGYVDREYATKRSAQERVRKVGNDKVRAFDKENLPEGIELRYKPSEEVIRQAAEAIDLEDRTDPELAGTEDGFGNSVAQPTKKHSQRTAAEALEAMNRNLDRKKIAKGSGDKKKPKAEKPKAEKPKAEKTTWAIYVMDPLGEEREITVAEGLGYKDQWLPQKEAIEKHSDRIILVVNQKNGNEYRKNGVAFRRAQRAVQDAAKAEKEAKEKAEQSEQAKTALVAAGKVEAK